MAFAIAPHAYPKSPTVSKSLGRVTLSLDRSIHSCEKKKARFESERGETAVFFGSQGQQPAD
eukprot:scaffold213222_cov28-Attheya_sp.AAC.2